MKITLNGESRQISSSNLSDLLEECGHEEQLVATAVNGEFVPIDERREQMLSEEDRIEILVPMQGG
ncbi:sulfur carrier protein ThiS [uncultured Cohaesibacter sp.]|uniref:sulfur carrier protein ThiS n=1 Tax=uncultured Cohaesibacter sp. TaxID=1002546 RepID=UPI0029C7E3E3|nr:sulfur carrier protein ThiS [uncultured Cohaesibacter sp.]